MKIENLGKSLIIAFFASALALILSNESVKNISSRTLTTEGLLEMHFNVQSPATNFKIVIMNTVDSPNDSLISWVTKVSEFGPRVIAIDRTLPDSIKQRLETNGIPLILATDGTEVPKQKDIFEYGHILSWDSRYHRKRIKENNREFLSLPMLTIKHFDKDLYLKAIDRPNIELINYLRDHRKFFFIDFPGIHLQDDEEYDKEYLKDQFDGSIVLFGYLGLFGGYPPSNGDLDTHETPIGKIYGIVKLANVIDTLSGNFLIEQSFPSTIILVFIICFVFGIGIYKIKISRTLWLIILVQLLVVVFVVLIPLACLILLHKFDYLIQVEPYIISLFTTGEATLIYMVANKIEAPSQ